MTLSPESFVEILQRRAAEQPGRIGYTFLRDGEESELNVTYAELDADARRIAAILQARGLKDQRVLLFYPAGMDFVRALFGCLYAGVVAVPAYPPDPVRLQRTLPRLMAIVADADVRAVLSTGQVFAVAGKAPSMNETLLRLERIATDARTDDSLTMAWRMPDPSLERLALLQYTSGSTGSPKGVMVTHGNAVGNARASQAVYRFSPDDAFACWVPLYHDLGLIGHLLVPLYCGSRSILMPPEAFIQRPLRWLKAISKYQAAMSGAPNFAFDLCARKATPEDCKDLDLSSWKYAINAAEPVRAETIERFVKAFSPYGFRRESLCPAYGLAESTAFATGGSNTSGPVVRRLRDAGLSSRAIPANGDDGSLRVGCGLPAPEHSVEIVNPETLKACPPGEVGEIWLSGPSICAGYWNRRELSEATFCARIAGREGTYLRTGDLGFVHEARLFVSGRIKDLIIIRGVNIYPQDVERTVEACREQAPQIRPGCGAAVAFEAQGQERLGVVQEIDTAGSVPEMSTIIERIRRAIAKMHGIEVSAVVLLTKGALPKTSSGKVMRHACRNFVTQPSSDRNEVVARWIADPSDAAEATADGETRADETLAPLGVDRDELEAWMLERLSRRLRVARIEVRATTPITELGLDSAAMVELTGDLERRLGTQLPATLLWQFSTVAEVATALTCGDRAAARPTPAVRHEDPIAIVGLGCRFPGGAVDEETFWALLQEGRDAVTDVPAERWDAEALFDKRLDAKGKAFGRWGGFIHDIDRFDAGFFGISPREAASMDPQQRLLLEVAWEALESAGQPVESLAGSRTGVFFGVATTEYSTPGDLARIDGHTGTGVSSGVAAGRLSYLLDLRGPSMAVDTACSSSLVAVHLARQSLRAGECDLALAGGVNIILRPDGALYLTQVGALAKDGRCKVFDASADGYVRSEGCGVVVLKRLSEARASGDRILAVIRGSAVNQDGRSNGLTAPNGAAQEAVIREALAQAGVSPAAVDYVEAHGTGTALGDPIELQALAVTYGRGRAAERPLWVGSLKANIGHAEFAAGIGGLIKTVLALQHRVIPPHVHFRTPTPHLRWDEVPLRVPQEAVTWQQERARLAGVSSFGFSGTNAHVILEEAPVETPDDSSADALTPLVLPLSGRTEAALASLATSYKALLGREGEGALALRDVVYTAAARRTHHEHRLAVVGSSATELVTALAAFGKGEAHPGLFRGEALPGARPKVAFVFPGQGSQWPGMGKGLLAHAPFREALETCAAALRPHMGEPLLDLLGSAEALDRVDVVQPALFALEVALDRLWRSLGILPYAVVGHSMGEIAAAHVAGALSLEDAARIVCARSRLVHRLGGRGGMAFVELSAEDVVRRLAGRDRAITIAACNGPRSTLVSGDASSLAALVTELEHEGVFARLVKVDYASHSPQVDEITGELEGELRGLRPCRGGVPIASTVTCELTDGSAFDADYWVRNLREPVRFDRAVRLLQAQGCTVFVEVSPHPILLSALESLSDHGHATSVGTLRRDRAEIATLAESLAQLYNSGVRVSWPAAQPRGRCISLPSYPWQRERHWLDGAGRAAAATLPWGTLESADTLLGPGLQSSITKNTWFFERTLSPELRPELRDHEVGGSPVLSAAMTVEIVRSAAGTAFDGEWPVVEELTFVEPLRLPSAVQVAVVREHGRAKFTVSSHVGTEWSTVSTGVLVAERAERPTAAPLPAARERCAQARSGDAHYADVSTRGAHYGPSMRWLDQVLSGADEAVGRLRERAGGRDYRFHPAALDAALQPVLEAAASQNRALWVPSSIARLALHGPPSREMWSHVQVRTREAREVVADVTLWDAEGRPIASLSGVRARAVEAAENVGTQVLFDVPWRSLPLSQEKTARPSGRWLVVGAADRLTDALRAALERRGQKVTVAFPRGFVRSEGLTVDVTSSAAFEALLKDSEPFAGVVHMGSLDIATDATTAQAIDDPSAQSWRSALALVQALARGGWRDPPRLWLLTRGAQRAGGAVAGSAVWGFGATVAREHPELECTRLDLDPAHEGSEADTVARILLSGEREDQLALREGRCWVPRIVPRPQSNAAGAVPSLRAEGTYLVTGGLGGLGPLFMRWMIERGARYLAVLTRSGSDTADCGRTVDELTALGARVEVFAADVGDRAQLTATLSAVRSAMPPLFGVVHMAVELSDALLVDQTAARFEQVLRAKAKGALHLHELTLGDPLHLFVLFSSASSVFGGIGHGAYAAANAVLCALAEYRAVHGRPALAVDWGVFEGLGVARRFHDAGTRHTVLPGLGGLTAADGLSALDELVRAGTARALALRLDVRRLLEGQPRLAGSPLLSELVGEGRKRGPSPLRQKLQSAAGAERPRLLETFVREELALVLRLEPTRVGRDVPMKALGLDSLTALELRDRLETALGLRLSAALLWTCPTISALTQYLGECLGWAVAPRAQAAEGGPSVTSDLGDPSADEAATLLKEELAIIRARKEAGK